MIQPSLIEIGKNFINVISSSIIYIFILILLIILSIYLYKQIQKDIKKAKKISLLSFVIVLFFFFLFHYHHFFDIFDKFIEKTFVIICFPDIFLYILALIIVNIVTFNSIFNFNTSRLIRIIYIAHYAHFHFITFLLQDIIVREKIDIYSILSIYANQTILNLVTWNSLIFLLFLIVVFVEKFTRKIIVLQNTDVEKMNPIDDNVCIVENRQEYQNNTQINSEMEKKKNLSIDEYKKIREWLIQMKQSNE